jgi:hypothetical protein
VIVMNATLSSLIPLLTDDAPMNAAQREQLQRLCAAVTEMTADDVTQLLTVMVDHAARAAGAGEARDDLVLSALALRQRHAVTPLDAQTREHILLLHKQLGEQSSCRWRLLQWLATAAGQEDLQRFAELLSQSPPPDGPSAAMTFAPLFQRSGYDPATLFPRLLTALQHLHLAAPVLDLCNYLVRTRRVDRHPAHSRLDELVALLGNVVQRLAQLEESPADGREDLDAMRRQVDDGVAVVIALCDALALIGDPRASGKLHQALALAHRRIRVEAAGALARLGESAGVETLVALAAEPVVRLRVLHTADELGLTDRIPPQYTTDAARAEAAVAAGLAQPAFFGIPPAELQLIDTRTQFWPGYETPVACYLFRYTYRFGTGQYSNVAIAGPLVHAFAADVNDLPPNDIYAAYAGWHVEHDSIYETPIEALPAAQRIEQARFERRLREAGFEDIQSTTLGHFFGDLVLVARAARHGVGGMAVIDAQDLEWYPHRSQRHPLGPFEAFCLYKGRRLLRAFNG